MERIPTALDIVFILFARRLIHVRWKSLTHSGMEKPAKNILRNERHTAKPLPDKKAVRREKWVFFLLFSFRKLSNEISSEKGDENTRTRCVKFHDVEKNLGLAELARFVRRASEFGKEMRNVDPRKRELAELAANENIYMFVGQKVDRRWLICHCWWWK